ncbi:MAG TPA: thioredoxin domain-containing protein [archaeon]|nr:thioredoxin domain-containing protein [archaeon]
MRHHTLFLSSILSLLLALSSSAGAGAPAKSEPLAEVDGAAITSAEVEQAIGAPLRNLEEQIYNLKRQKLEALIADRLLAREAAKRGLTVQALLDAEVTAKVGLVTEQEIETFYQANKAQLKGEEATVREQIRSYLQNQKLAAQRQAFVQSLRTQAKIVVHLQAPPVFRADVSVDGAPFKGSATAPVTVVEFTDFHCPFCKQVQPTLDQLLTKYAGKVKLVYRDFPIDQLHPQARRAHEAARCANDQGKFWPYHDRLYATAPKGSPEDLKTYAQEVGLNLPAFEQCFNSRKYQAAVQQDEDAGVRAGVTGTPAFFINGRLLSGAQPLESFARLIDEELARTH